MPPGDIITKIVDEVLQVEGLKNSNWDYFSVVVEIEPGMTSAYSYAYTDSRKPIPVQLSIEHLFDEIEQLRQSAMTDGQSFDGFIIQHSNQQHKTLVRYLYGDEVAQWHISPDNLTVVQEALRPNPADFNG